MPQSGLAGSAAPELIDLGRDRTLEIRPTTAADGELIRQLYDPLSVEDRRRRFFNVFRPDLDWCRNWASVAERGGYGVIAIVHHADHDEVAGEAGYAIRKDGDGDLAVTVAPDWRGWLGSYLVELLAQQAAANGIANLQADVLLENRAMLTILQRRGSVNLEHSDGVVRLTIGTADYAPSWPPDAEGRKVLVATPGGRWSGEHAATNAGCVTAVCSGPARRERAGCPVLDGGRCPLADGADALVILLDPDDEDTERLIALHRRHRPEVPIFISSRLAETGTLPSECVEVSGSPSGTVDHILSMIGQNTTSA